MLGHLGATFGHVGSILCHLGTMLGLSWAILGLILGHLGAMLGLCWVKGYPPEVVMLFFSTSRKHRKLRGVGGSAAGAVLRVPNSTARSTGPAGPI